MTEDGSASVGDLEWGTPVITVNGVEGTTFTVPDEDATTGIALEVTNTLLGTFSVEKSIVDDAESYVGDRTFDVDWTCTADGIAEGEGTGTANGTIAVVPGASAVTPQVNGQAVEFAAGTTCSFSEVIGDESGDFAEGSNATWADPVMTSETITIGADAVTPQVVSVTNTVITPESVGSFGIAKRVINEGGLDLSGDLTFSGDYICAGEGDSTLSGTWSTRAGETTLVSGIPAGWTCEVTFEDSPETVPGGTWNTDLVVDPVDGVSVEANDTAVITVTKTLTPAPGPTPTPTPTQPSTPGEAPNGGGLAATGSDVAPYLARIALLPAARGGALVFSRRRGEQRG